MASPLTDPTVRILERQVLPGLLGVRFWDAAATAPVLDGLVVQATDVRDVVVDAVQNRSGVWHFPRLPGINTVDVATALTESGSVLGSPITARPFVVSVFDTARRFHPVEFEVLAPVDGGLYDWPFGGVTPNHASPPVTGYVPLFSTASRPAPSGRLVVHADLWDVAANRAASWALLEITAPGANGDETFLGLADARGAVATFLPVPFIAVDGVRIPAAQRTWDIGVRVWYAPALTIDRDTDSPPTDATTPTLEQILAQRDVLAAEVFARRGPDVLLTSATLRLSESLILRTDPDGLETQLQSYLLVNPSP